MGETDLRDAMALERTHFANERTFLAYVRTSLALLIGGAMVLRFLNLEQDPLFTSFAWLSVVVGSAILIFGSYRFISVRRRIYR